MSDVAIRVEGLGKKYSLGKRERYGSLRDSIVQAPRSLWARLSAQRGEGGNGSSAPEEMWALKDVSFEVKRGEVVGVIGRNGAGKSTLLKILSRITEPTTGRAEIHGRVGSLLEVGTGFHPELTGRENIYLSGAILGMRRGEVDREFSSIVEFADIGSHLDSPVKQYSSGMHVRLAFAVAAHLEPEILLVDEVLSVGDANFQRKSLGKMLEISRHGRTVLFVSHNMPAIARMCRRVVVLGDGGVVYDGSASAGIASYSGAESEMCSVRTWNDDESAPGDSVVGLLGVSVRDQDGSVGGEFDVSEEIHLDLEYVIRSGNGTSYPFVRITNENGTLVFISASVEGAVSGEVPSKPGHYVATCTIPSHFLAEGSFLVSPGIASFNPNIDRVLLSEVVGFRILDSMDGNGARGQYTGAWDGVVRPLLRWKLEKRATSVRFRRRVG